MSTVVDDLSSLCRSTQDRWEEKSGERERESESRNRGNNDFHSQVQFSSFESSWSQPGSCLLLPRITPNLHPDVEVDQSRRWDIPHLHLTFKVCIVETKENK